MCRKILAFIRYSTLIHEDTARPTGAGRLVSESSVEVWGLIDVIGR